MAGGAGGLMPPAAVGAWRMTVYSVSKLISEARRLARDYRRATGKPLGGVGAEIAQHDAARLLDLELCRAAGYDAVGRGPRAGRRIQIKGRALFDGARGNPRIGQIRPEQAWDSLVLVLMDADYEPVEIYEAERDVVLAELAAASDGRRRRGALSVARFRRIGRLVWSHAEGVVRDEVWDNLRDGGA